MSKDEEIKELTTKLENITKTYNDFLYIASHDLHTPIRITYSFLTILKDKYSKDWDENANEYLTFAIDNTLKLKEMLDGLLQISRVNTKGEEFSETNMNECLNEALKQLKSEIKLKNATIEHAELPEIKADSKQIILLFKHLIDNALKFNRPDTTPKISINSTTKNNSHLISIKDEGIGIDEEFYKHVFKIFRKLHTDEEYTGYGVGLAICEKIVERHGGKIWIESQKNFGTTVLFTIPNEK